MKVNWTNVLIGAIVIGVTFYFLKPTTEGFGFLRPSVDIGSGAPKTQAQIDNENKYKGTFSSGEKIGIWIGIFAAVALIGGVGYYFYTRNRNA